jgi:hypothetical protein
MPVQLLNQEAWFSDSHGFPQPDWNAIAEWIERSVPEADHDGAWEQCARSWLQRLVSRLGEGYTVAESPNFRFLSDLPAESRRSKLLFLEDARRRMRDVLGEALSAAEGKHVVLRFSAIEDFDAYISHFHPDGEFGGTSGTFLRTGYPHIAYPQVWSDQPDAPVLVHELAHNLMAHLPIPSWLNEALAMAFEADIAGTPLPPLTRELAGQHRDYWTATTIQEFWSGRAFSSVEAQELAYSLSRVMLNLIYTELRPSRQEFRAFVQSATWDDAGAAAAEKHLDIPLENIVAAFLGPGEWRPQPDHWSDEAPD